MSDKSRADEQLKALRMPPQAPRVFVSYSHESAEHKNWVLRLASDLRKHGVDAILDVWDLKPGGDVARFMEHLASVDRVVIICSEDYVRKAKAGKGGVGYETMLVTAEILQDRGVVKFIPVLRSNADKTLPEFLRTKMWIDFEHDADYSVKLEELVRVLHEVPAIPKPALGSNPYSSGGVAVRDVFADEWFHRHQSAAMAEVQPRGAFMEIAFGMTSYALKSDLKTILNVAERSAIHTFGWPIGIVLHVKDKSPKPEPDGIVTKITTRGFSSDYERADCWALRLNGDFYLAQNLFENGRDPGAIFFNTRMIRTAEALLYCRNLYSNLGVSDGAAIRFRIRHAGIKGRTLSSSNPARMLWPIERTIASDTSTAAVEFGHPLTDRDIVEKTRELLNPLFALFDFFEPDESVYQDVVGNFIQGRCT
jgi:hypothetical protein